MGRLFQLLAASLIIATVTGCGKTTQGPTEAAPTTTQEAATTEATTEAATTTEPDKCTGENIEVEKPADGEEYAQREGGPVKTGDELEFEAEKGGCWTNYKPPVDELDFVVLKDGAALEECAQANPAPPSGKVIAVVAPQGAEGSAAYHSCSILCAEGPPVVTLEGTHSDDIDLDVCLADSFQDEVLLRDCTHIFWGKPTTIGSSARNSIFNIVIVANNFQEPGSYAAIKSIKVETKECDNSGKICEEAGCTFDKDACLYVKSDQQTDSKLEFRPYNDPNTIVGNTDTGVHGLFLSFGSTHDKDGATYPEKAENGFLATVVDPGALIVMETDVSEVETDDIEMEFDYFEATDQQHVKVCFDDISNCPFQSDTSVALEHRSWAKGKAKIPKGTTKVFLVAENVGNRYGAAGFNEITFSKGGEPLCDIVSRRRK